MTRVLMAATAAFFLTCGSAYAQMGASAPSPPAATTPLGISPVPPAAVSGTGIPLGTAGLGSMGVNPGPSGMSSVSPPTSSSATCSGISSPAGNLSGGINGGPSNTPSSLFNAPGSLFDGGGVAGTASGTCAGIATGPAGGPAASASSPTGMGSTSPSGRGGIPMGSTELGVGGVSPPAAIPPPTPSAPVSTFGSATP